MKKTIDINDSILPILEALAKKEGRNLKNYIEQVLIKMANKYKAIKEESK